MAYEISNQIWALRDKFAEKKIDTDTFVENVETMIEKKSLRKNAKINAKTLDLLCTGELLLEKISKPFDFSPCAIEFCKAVENEFHDTIFGPFQQSFLRKSIKVERQDLSGNDHLLFCFVTENAKIALGQMAFLFQTLGNRKEVEKSLVFRELMIFVEPILDLETTKNIFTIDRVNEYRNSSAHRDTFTLEKAVSARAWSYKLINLLFQKLEG